MPTPSRRLLIALTIVASVIFLGGRARETLGIAFDVESVRVFAEGLGPYGPFLFVLVVAGRSLLWLPSQVVLIAAGLCFGTVVGSLVGGAGLMISGFFLFTLARFTGRDAIEQRMGHRVRHLLTMTERRSGAMAFGLACGYPVSPLSPLQAVAGLTPMPLPNFVSSAFIGGAIRASIYAYFGDALTDASLSSLAWPTLAFAVVAGAPLVFPSGRAWLREIFVPPGPGAVADVTAETGPEIVAEARVETARD